MYDFAREKHDASQYRYPEYDGPSMDDINDYCEVPDEDEEDDIEDCTTSMNSNCIPIIERPAHLLTQRIKPV